jgi:hypothetical protein
VQVGTEKRFDEDIAFPREFIREEMGEMLALKAWYCDSIHRYTMTDALQPVIEASEMARRPEGNPKADLSGATMSWGTRATCSTRSASGAGR